MTDEQRAWEALLRQGTRGLEALLHPFMAQQLRSGAYLSYPVDYTATAEKLIADLQVELATIALAKRKMDGIT